MPTPPLSRRTAVSGAAALTALLAAGCTGDSGGSPDAARSPGRSTTAPPTRTPESPDVALAAAVLRDERALLDRVAATVRRHPRLAVAVSGARSAHEAHVALLMRAVASDSPTPGPRPRVRARQVPRSPGPALAALARAERRLTAAGERNAVRAESGAFARVLASMAGASAQQATRLTELARARR